MAVENSHCCEIKIDAETNTFTAYHERHKQILFPSFQKRGNKFTKSLYNLFKVWYYFVFSYFEKDPFYNVKLSIVQRITNTMIMGYFTNKMPHLNKTCKILNHY